MNKEKQLIEDVEILLENSVFNAGPDYFVPTNNSKETPRGIFSSIVDEPGTHELYHEQSLDLARLYQQQNIQGQQSIDKILSKNLKVGTERAKTAARFYIATSQIAKLINFIFKNLKSYRDRSFYHALLILNQNLYLQWNQYALSEIKTIRKWTGDYLEGKNKIGDHSKDYPGLYEEYTELIRALYRQTNIYLSKDVKNRINSGHNPEINIDKDILKKEFKKFGFPADLSETLDKVDNKFNQARDAFDFKGCMDLLRAFTERLYESILNEYGAEGRKVNVRDSEAIAKFFKDKKLISDHFADMLAAQRHFLSDKAAHRLKSRVEDARLSKNMVIEMSLYLLRRYENH